MRAIILHCLLCVFSLLSLRAELAVDCTGAARPATKEEIRMLYGLATHNPKKFKVVADIRAREAPWSQQQIDDELGRQSEVLKEKSSRLSPRRYSLLQLAQSNSIAQSHSGDKVKHVREWYSGKSYRQDITDESFTPLGYWLQNSNAYLFTYANVATRGLNFSVNHALRSVLVDRSTSRRFAKTKLGRAFGLDDVAASPLALALMKPPTSVDILPSIDDARIKSLHELSDPIWRLEACDTTSGNNGVVCFHLSSGRFVDLDEAGRDSKRTWSSISVKYWIAKIAERNVCLKSYYTNLTYHSSVLSEREEFDHNGLPHLWKVTHFKNGRWAKETTVRFTEIDLVGKFLDEEIFSTTFPSNYTVGDVTSGKSILLQNPRPEISTKILEMTPVRKKTLVIALLAILGLIAISAMIRMIKKQ